MKKFLISEATTYQEIADYLVDSDPNGVSNLLQCLFDKKPELIQEIKEWEMFK